MNVPFLDLSRQAAALRDDLQEAFAGVLERGRFLGGEFVEEFERAFAAYCGVEHCVAVGSGTAALELALRAVGVGSGDEVITAANTCLPTVAAIEHAGATPVLVDAGAATATLEVDALEDALTPRTRAIVPVHLYGQLADMRGVVAFARQHGLRVVEDAAQAHGAELDGARAGSFGDAAAYSFYPTKNLGALGDGGAVVTTDAEVADRVRVLRAVGERGGGSIRGGTTSRLDTLQAAVLSRKLTHLDGWTERRRELAARYLEALAVDDVVLPVELEGRRHVYHLFVIQVAERDRFRERLARARVETLVHYPLAVHQHPAYRDLGRRGLERSERLAATVVSLPLYPELADEEQERVIEAVLAA